MKNKIKQNIPGIILVISALILGTLVIFLVARSKDRNRTVISFGETTGNEETSERASISGNVPLPNEITEADKKIYFISMEIPDLIFKRMDGVSFNKDCPVKREDLRYLKLLYWGRDTKPHTGEMVVNAEIAEDVVDVFFTLYKNYYTIERMTLIDDYGANDEVSMGNNNTSAFVSREVTGGGALSYHAYGAAIDLNPLFNPYVKGDEVLPVTANAYTDRDRDFIMKITHEDLAYRLFTEKGFKWGGDYESLKDYQHFEKKVSSMG